MKFNMFSNLHKICNQLKSVSTFMEETILNRGELNSFSFKHISAWCECGFRRLMISVLKISEIFLRLNHSFHLDIDKTFFFLPSRSIICYYFGSTNPQTSSRKG